MLFNFLKNGSQNMFFSYIYPRVSVLSYTKSTTTPNQGKNLSLMVNYLIKTLGFTEKEAIDTSTKLTTLKSTQNPDSVIDFLTTTGFNKTHVKKLVFIAPKILTFDVDKTLRPKLNAFMDVGLVGSDLADIVCQSDVLVRSLDGHIRPTLDVLRSVFCDHNDCLNMFLVRALKSSSWMLDSRIRTTLPVCYSLLESYGLSVEQIQRLVISRTRYVLVDPEWLKYVLIRIEEQIGIPRESGMFYHGIFALCTTGDESLKSKFNLLKSLGFSDEDIMTMGRSNPYTLTLAEATIRRKVNVLMDELGCTPAGIARRACMLTYSIERRILPRHVVIKVLKEKGLIDPNYNLVSCIYVTDSSFIKKFVLPYKDQVPDLYDDFIRKVNVPNKTA